MKFLEYAEVVREASRGRVKRREREEVKQRERSVMALKWVDDVSIKCIVHGKESF